MSYFCLKEMNDEIPPEPSEDVNTYVDVANCLIRKIQSGLSKIGLAENLRDTIKKLEQSQVRVEYSIKKLEANY